MAIYKGSTLIAGVSTPVAGARNVGQIIQSTLPLTDAGLHLLDGSVITGGGIYNAFVEYIANMYEASASYFCTEVEWQQSITDYGVCGKFVYTAASGSDPATVRLPLIEGFTEGTIDTAVLGDLTEAGLPNITGTIATGDRGFNASATGAFTTSGSTTYAGSPEASGSKNAFSFDASSSSSIYGNSNTVQPQSIKVLYYIVVTTSTKSSIEADIDEIATDLNQKVDRSTLVDAKVVLTTYKAGTSWYRLYSDNWCEQGGAGTGTATVTFLKPFADTNYNIDFGITYTDTTAYTPTVQATSKTTTTMNVSARIGGSSSSVLTYTWKASGYIAS